MSIIKRATRKAEALIMPLPRKLYYRKLRKKLKNNSPTIISSDCFGGLAYHSMGLQFRSPTVNLFFSPDDFIAFVQNLQGYLDDELEEITDTSVSYPVGVLDYMGRKIRINFMHYKTFDQAKEKWNQRKQRIDYSNIFIIQTLPSATEERIRAFDTLPFENKMLITGKNPINSENVCIHPVFLKKNYQSGQFLRYKSMFSLKRYMDEIDYIGFFNRNN